MKLRAMAIPVALFFLVLGVPHGGRAQSSLQMTPGQPSPSQVTPVQLPPEEMADLYMARKEYKEAAATYRQLTAKFPGNPFYFNKLGMAYQQLLSFGSASRSYEHAIKLDPAYADAMNNLGTIYYSQKKYSRAIRAYQKAISIRPEMAVLYSNLGYAYFAAKKYEESITAFRKALDIDPGFFEQASSRNAALMQNRSVEDRGRFYYFLAKSFAQAKNVERCIHYLRKAREEGFKSMNSVKTDPAFTAVLSDVEIQELLAPHPDSAHP
jgi:tetratricopeptide (TPR) repeat protein